MKYKFSFFSLLLLSLASFTSCVSISSEHHSVIAVDGPFDELIVANNIEVTYSPGDKVSYSIDASAKAKSHLEMTVSGNALTIKAEDLRNEKIKIRLTAPAINTFKGMNNAVISIEGSLDLPRLDISAYNNAGIEFAQNVKAPKVDISAYNNGNVELEDLSTDRLTATAYNNGEIDLAGAATSVIYSAYNNGDIDASRLKADRGSADASNNATIRASVTQLDQTTSNLAKIYNR